MSIRKKLLSGFATVIILLITISTFTYFQFSSVNDEYSQLIEDRTNKIYLSSNLSHSANIQRLGVRGYIIDGDKTYLDEIREAQQSFDEELETLLSLTNSSEEIALLKELEEVQLSYRNDVEDIIVAMDAKDELKARTILNGTGAASALLLNDTVDSLVAHYKEEMLTTSQVLTDKTDTTILLIFISSILSILIAIFTALSLSKNISGPIKKLSIFANEIANNNLQIDSIQIRNKDEIGYLAKSFNQMKDNLREIVYNVNKSSEQVAASAEQLLASSEQTVNATHQVSIAISDVASRIDTQNTNTEESARTLSEIAIGVQRVAKSTETVAESANETKNQANLGNESVEKLVNQMDFVYRVSKDLRISMEQLQDRSNEIGKITEVITNIANQTNLLALNASIEAARAGENGRGFSVVADEVKKLAEQSAVSANQISAIINEIRNQTSAAVQNTIQGNNETKNALSIAEDTKDIFKRILGQINEVNIQAQELSAISEEISASTEEVNSAIDDVAKTSKVSAAKTQEISATSQEQLATMEEVNAAATSLATIAEELKDKVNSFKI